MAQQSHEKVQGRFRGAGDTDDSGQGVFLSVVQVSVISDGLGLPG